MKYYDSTNHRLVFVSNEANEQFWDEMWQQMARNIVYAKQPPKYNLFLNTTRKYLQPGATILEGGCGLAENSWNFQLAGFNAIALDYTPKTVDFLKSKIPEVHPTIGDVRQLPFDNESFDGYWSFGVIEHFYDGYEEIANEAYRVIKKDGYLFLTFPHMSKFRRFKVQQNRYPVWEESVDNRKDFYQFALDEEKVISRFEELGFEWIETKPFDGLGGLRRESNFMLSILNKIYISNNLGIKVIRKILDIIIAPFTSHSVLLVLKKKQ